MGDHKHGEMDITNHEKMFENFIRWSAWVAAVSILALIFMALVNS